MPGPWNPARLKIVQVCNCLDPQPDTQVFGFPTRASPKFKQPKTSLNLFSLGSFAPPDPPFKSAAVAASASQVRTLKPSRPLSRPPGGEDLRGTRPGTGLEAQDQARDWPGGPGPGQGLARRPCPSQAILFLFAEIKKLGFVIFGGGSATPRQTGKILFGGGQNPDRHF